MFYQNINFWKYFNIAEVCVFFLNERWFKKLQSYALRKEINSNVSEHNLVSEKLQTKILALYNNISSEIETADG